MTLQLTPFAPKHNEIAFKAIDDLRLPMGDWKQLYVLDREPEKMPIAAIVLQGSAFQ